MKYESRIELLDLMLGLITTWQMDAEAARETAEDVAESSSLFESSMSCDQKNLLFFDSNLEDVKSAMRIERVLQSLTRNLPQLQLESTDMETGERILSKIVEKLTMQVQMRPCVHRMGETVYTAMAEIGQVYNIEASQWILERLVRLLQIPREHQQNLLPDGAILEDEGSFSVALTQRHGVTRRTSLLLGRRKSVAAPESNPFAATYVQHSKTDVDPKSSNCAVFNFDETFCSINARIKRQAGVIKKVMAANKTSSMSEADFLSTELLFAALSNGDPEICEIFVLSLLKLISTL
ncbi:hypothetical protein Ciccas_010287 [Cichlidogyrus casuarinus]|uniref:Uncharacterized protein n=1 Tax=Cichlidogyrus casuarinus TaxID=1844966 RepID=A0ABD2PZ56_9PLAT